MGFNPEAEAAPFRSEPRGGSAVTTVGSPGGVEGRRDVDCVRFYRRIRGGVGGDARRLSVGRNLFPTSAALKGALADLAIGLVESDRFSDYETEADGRTRALIARLVDLYLGGVGVEAEHVFLTNGAQEAISIVCGYASQKALPALLPLPLYYSFEQSARRWGIPTAGYYRADGSIHWTLEPAARVFQTAIVPNGVTGTLFQTPFAGPGASTRAPLTLVDCVFQLGCLAANRSLGEPIRALVSDLDLECAALVFTASKDLSLPGLRAGLLVSRDPALLDHTRADRFERVYAVSPLVGAVMALYFALLLLYESRTALVAGVTWGELAELFRGAGIAFPGEGTLGRILGGFDAMGERSRRNLELLAGQDLPLSLNGDLHPTAGYSVFPRVDRSFSDGEEFIRWVHRAGLDFGLKINPNYLFGARPEIWEALYPREYRIRVNVSDEPAELAASLERLAAAVEG